LLICCGKKSPSKMPFLDSNSEEVFGGAFFEKH
jgi:hypothetical protein